MKTVQLRTDKGFGGGVGWVGTGEIDRLRRTRPKATSHARASQQSTVRAPHTRCGTGAGAPRGDAGNAS